MITTDAVLLAILAVLGLAVVFVVLLALTERARLAQIEGVSIMRRQFSREDLHRAYLRSRLASKMTFEQAMDDTYNRTLLETIARGLTASAARSEMRPTPRNLVNIANRKPPPPGFDQKRLASGDKPEPDDE